MKKTLLSIAVILGLQSCTHSSKTASDASNQQYGYTVHQNVYDAAAGHFVQKDVTVKLEANNDTVAYLSALKRFYNQKIVERREHNYGEPRSFQITDKNGVDLSIKLPKSLSDGLKQQVESLPEVAKMISEYNADSLAVD